MCPSTYIKLSNSYCVAMLSLNIVTSQPGDDKNDFLINKFLIIFNSINFLSSQLFRGTRKGRTPLTETFNRPVIFPSATVLLSTS